jgi:glycosyltransferase involved in cell wall biosynthesis
MRNQMGDSFNGERLYVVMPIYNEEASIAAVVREWKACLDTVAPDHRILILNDGSKDNTAQILAEIAASTPGIEVINKPNSGHGRTCIYGYGEAIARGARWVFQIDSDGQCDPQYFQSVWERRTMHPAIFGQRVDRDDGAARKFISLFCRVATHVATGVPVRDPNVPYRLMRADVLDAAIRGFPADFGLSNILVAVIVQRGLGRKMGFEPIGFRDRTGGEPSVKWMKFVTEGWRLYAALGGKRRHVAERAAEIARLAAAPVRTAHVVAPPLRGT